MADIFLREEVNVLLKNKFVLILGDSNARSLYRDLLFLHENNDIAPPEIFRRTSDTKRWNSFEGDKVLRLPEVDCPGRDHFEEREYKRNLVHIRYHFITKAYGKEMEQTIDNIEKGVIPIPNIIIMNSCTYDLTRWGPMQEDNYKNDLIALFSRLRRILPDDTLPIWFTTLPIAVQQCKGGFLIKQLDFMKHSLRFMILEANKFTAQLCHAFGIDLLDLHYHMRFQLQRRAVDGLHWETHAIRHMTCLILTHITLSLDVPLPGHVQNRYIETAVNNASEAMEPPDLKDIGFHKEVEDKIAEELSKPYAKLVLKLEGSQCLPDDSTEHNQKQRNNPDVKPRVTVNARRRLQPSEQGGFSVSRPLTSVQHEALWPPFYNNGVINRRINTSFNPYGSHCEGFSSLNCNFNQPSDSSMMLQGTALVNYFSNLANMGRK